MSLDLAYEEIFKKINSNCKDSELNDLNDNNEFYNLLRDYLVFLKHPEYSNKLRAILDIILNYYKVSNVIFFADFELSKDEKLMLISLFIFKSINKISITPTIQDVSYRSTDSILNDFTEAYNYFYIFYLQKSIIFDTEYRKEIFKLLFYLKEYNCLVKKTIFCNNKTQNEWSLNVKNIEINDISHLKISHTPPKLINLENNYYLVGNFFTNVQKIFIENIHSGHFFKLHDIQYLKRMVSSKIFMNIHDLSDLTKYFSKKGITEGSIKISIKKNNEILKKNSDTINFLKKNNKIEIIKHLRLKGDDLFAKNSNFIDIKKWIINFIYLTYKNKLKKTINVEKSVFINNLYSIFIKKYSIDYLHKNKKINFTDFKKFKWNESEFNFTKMYDNVEDILKFEKNINTDIDEKYNKTDPHKISFILYLTIFSKKEIEGCLNELKNVNVTEKIVNEDIIEFDENKTDSTYLLNSILFKFDQTCFKNNRIKATWSQINKLNIKNTELFSKISKSIHIYNLFILKKYINKPEITKMINYVGNIEIYFMFFFDFRGRFYYNSTASPTNNKYIRLILNYGHVSDFHLWNKKSNLYNHLLKYFKNIEKIKIMYNIETQEFDETIFWIAISIGKININKELEKVSIEEFLNNATKLLENNSLKDDFDICEFNYYKKILVSLKNPLIVKRCLLKDATASFFQNLIRILDVNNDDYLKIANLNSMTHWFDWYSHILNKWKNEEKLNSLYNETLHKWFTRKSVKKVIMTLPYSATFPTCFGYFKDSLLYNYKKKIQINDNIYKIFLRFYKFVNNYTKNEIFFKNMETIVENFKKIIKKNEQIEIISKNNDKANLTYFKFDIKHFDLIVKSKDNKKTRLIKNYKKIDMVSIDTRKTIAALKANLVHHVDALLVRDVNKKIYYYENLHYISIHDSFLVNFLNISDFILNVNEQMNEKVFYEELRKNKKNYFSIFIFL